MEEFIAKGYLEYPKELTKEQQKQLEISSNVMLRYFVGEEEINASNTLN